MPPALFRKLFQMGEIRLRVAGIGFDIQLSVPGPSSTIADVLTIVADETKIPAPYLLLLFRGKKLTDGDATDGENLCAQAPALAQKVFVVMV